MVRRTAAQDGQLRSAKLEDKALGLIWIDCPYPMVSISLTKILNKEAWVHVGRKALAGESLSSIILGTDGMEGLLEDVKRLQRVNPYAPILVCGLRLDLLLAQAALRAGARGFIHIGMQPEQIVRAIKVAAEGEMVAPRGLLGYLIAEESAGLDALSARKREILEHVGEGLTNAQIAKRLFIAESTVKQHLRAAYKLLGRPQQPLWAAVTGCSGDQQQGQKGEQNGQIN